MDGEMDSGALTPPCTRHHNYGNTQLRIGEVTRWRLCGKNKRGSKLHSPSMCLRHYER